MPSLIHNKLYKVTPNFQATLMEIESEFMDNLLNKLKCLKWVQHNKTLIAKNFILN